MMANATPNKFLAAVRVRGDVRITTKTRDTLYALRLRNKHVCVVVPDTPALRGALVAVKDQITFGPIDAETRKLLEEKRGEQGEDDKLKPYFRLHPPRGGFERKGIKKTFAEGGALGDRGEKINLLIRKML